MFLNHCISLLISGESSIEQGAFTNIDQIMFKLETGVSAKKLDSIKTSLMMIEAINLASRHAEQDELIKLFDNFVTYAYSRFREPIVMAIMKYAIADRKLMVRRVDSSKCWHRVAKSFKPSLLNNSKKPVDVRVHSQFQRCYSKLKMSKSTSDHLNTYLQAEMKTPTQSGAKDLVAMMT